MQRLVRRCFSTGINDPLKLRNIGISAHIDSGKTTLTERILFYTGRISAIHEVRGKDGVGAKMDSMELEREKGITIQSAATYTKWKDTNVNIIDTPGHVDFTVEVERALRVLDGAILVLCSVGGVQSQSITVDRQMKRYNVPRLAFINKLDRVGASPWRVIKDLRDKLRLNAAAVQLPIGLEGNLSGIVDIVTEKAFIFEGNDGEIVKEVPVPDDMKPMMAEKRHVLFEKLGDVDEIIADYFIMEEAPPLDALKTAIRKATIANKFVPVFMGSAFKNRGVQILLDGVVDYLPNPREIPYEYLDTDDNEKPVPMECDATKPLVALAFKLEESRFGQLTYVRIYQGTLTRGATIRNTSTGKKLKVPRVVRMHSDEMEDVQEVGPGEIACLFGLEASSGDTLCDDVKGFNPSMMTMFIPEPVVSLAVEPKDKSGGQQNFSRALQRFQREDPTFRCRVDDESKQTIISGMGELHLEVYLERMKREYKCETISGMPQVNYRETIFAKSNFNYLHKKQSGGAGQYGRVEGFIEPMTPEEIADNHGNGFLFVNGIVGNAIPPEYIAAVGKGFEEQMGKGLLVGHPVTGIKVTITDGSAHAVDSSELAFKLAAQGAFRQSFQNADPQILEPIMSVSVEVPDEYQGSAIALLNKRRAVIVDSGSMDGFTSISAHAPLSGMFGFSMDLRSSTQGKGEFTMEFSSHERMPSSQQQLLIDEYKAKRKSEESS